MMPVKEWRGMTVLKCLPRIYKFYPTSYFAKLSPVLFDLHSQYSWVISDQGFLSFSTDGNLRPTEVMRLFK